MYPQYRNFSQEYAAQIQYYVRCATAIVAAIIITDAGLAYNRKVMRNNIPASLSTTGH